MCVYAWAAIHTHIYLFALSAKGGLMETLPLIIAHLGVKKLWSPNLRAEYVN